MTRPRTNRARLPLQQRGWSVVIGALMLLALLGPHSPWSVCLTGRCGPPTATTFAASVDLPTPATLSCCCSQAAAEATARTTAPTASCCAAEETPIPMGPEPRNGADSCHGCCIDLATDIDEGPMPEPVLSPDVETGIAAILPPAPTGPGSAPAARAFGFDTGPPRPAELLGRIATTVLRE